MDSEILVNYYFMGYELGSDDAPFPNWFETYKEKMACLLGYNDFNLGITREREEILKELCKIK